MSYSLDADHPSCHRTQRVLFSTHTPSTTRPTTTQRAVLTRRVGFRLPLPSGRFYYYYFCFFFCYILPLFFLFFFIFIFYLFTVLIFLFFTEYQRQGPRETHRENRTLTRLQHACPSAATACPAYHGDGAYYQGEKKKKGGGRWAKRAIRSSNHIINVTKT